MFHITLLTLGYFISNRYGCFGDVQNPQLSGHQSQPLGHSLGWATGRGRARETRGQRLPEKESRGSATSGVRTIPIAISTPGKVVRTGEASGAVRAIDRYNMYICICINYVCIHQLYMYQLYLSILYVSILCINYIWRFPGP